MASRTVRARLDDRAEEALELLLRGGATESEIVRTALVEAADRRRRRAGLADEVAMLAADPVDSAERRAVMDDLRSLGPVWPE